MTRWDGRTKKPHPVTGEMVPDENARVEVMRLLGAQPARWPKADFIIGNPPFIGGEVYARGVGRRLRGSIVGRLPADAAIRRLRDVLVEPRGAAGLRRSLPAVLALITTNSLPQAFNRRIVKAYLEHVDGISLAFAIPNHPWVDAIDAANVRIAMTVGVRGRDRPGRLLEAMRETPLDDGEADVEFSERNGVIHADLRIGADLTRALPLRANEGLCSPGVKLHGAGFIVTPDSGRGAWSRPGARSRTAYPPLFEWPRSDRPQPQCRWSLTCSA